MDNSNDFSTTQILAIVALTYFSMTIIVTIGILLTNTKKENITFKKIKEDFAFVNAVAIGIIIMSVLTMGVKCSLNNYIIMVYLLLILTINKIKHQN